MKPSNTDFRLCGMADYGDGLLHGECVAIGSPSNPYTL